MWLELDGGFVIGEGGLDLLTAIATHGSLRRARWMWVGPIAIPGATCDELNVRWAGHSRVQCPEKAKLAA